jgi:hypothetical protein
VVNAACGISRASFAIRSSFVDTVVELDVSAIFPSNVPVSRCSLPSAGSLGSVPPLLRYYEALRFPAALPTLLRFLRSAVPPPRLGLRSRSRKTLRLRAGGLLTGLPHTGFIDGGDRTSQVPGEPHYERALLFDSGGTSALGHYHALMLPSAFSTASAPARTVISELNHTARSLAVYASQDGLPHHHARLASGWLAGLSGRDWVPAGFQRKVSGECHSPFPGFAWRTEKLL